MNPASEKVMDVGQDRIYKDASAKCDAAYGTYNGGLAKGAKPTIPGPGPLPNTPNPFTLR
jgi:hypothetical protein